MNNLDLLVILGSVSIMMFMTYLLTKSIIENKSNGLRKYNEKVNEYINSIINHSSDFKDLISIDIHSAAVAENSFEDEVHVLRRQVKSQDEKLAYFEKSSSVYQEENSDLLHKIKQLEITDKDLIQVESLTQENNELKKIIHELKNKKNVNESENKQSLKRESDKLVSILNLVGTNSTKGEDSEIDESNDAKIVKLEKVTENMDKDEIIDVFKKLLAS